LLRARTMTDAPYERVRMNKSGGAPVATGANPKIQVTNTKHKQDTDLLSLFEFWLLGFGILPLQHAQCDLVLLLHLRAVADDAGLTELPLPLRLHVRVQVPPPDLAVLQLARGGHLDPLLDALVRLVLGGHWSDTPCAGAEG